MNRLASAPGDAGGKERLWPVVAGVYAPYDEYQRKTDRDIPVILLERV